MTVTTPRRRPYPTHAENLAALPTWTQDPLARLEHTLAAHPNRNPAQFALYALLSTHPEPGQPAQTGITWGDLERLAVEVRRARAARNALAGGEH